ncbi:MAG: FtsX-like permease family protein [Vicinamibacteria bacterium]
MALPLSYNVRSVRARWRATVLAICSIALVVAAVEVLMSMSEGFATALRSTGRMGNAMIVERGASAELASTVTLAQRNTILDDPRVARGPDGLPLASWEWVTVIALPKKADGRRASVRLRVVSARTFDVRGGIRMTAGRRFSRGLDEVIVGRRIIDRVSGLALDGKVRFRRKEFKIVGIFESDGAAFESEIWADFDTAGPLFGRGTDAKCMVVRMKDPGEIPALDRWMRNQPGMKLQAVPETQYYENQSGFVSTILKGLAALVALFMGAGAVFGAMNTMYAIVAVRTREIGTLRALGFSRPSILVSFVVESALLALVGGALGCLLALGTHGYSTSVSNLQSFSEVAYAFRVTPRIIASGMAFALVVGVVGGLLPALCAARLPIAMAVRAP